jgi:hypothetical protein
LGKNLLALFGLNCWTSTDVATSTCDPKHIFKCFAMRGSGSSNGGKTGVYEGVLVRNMHGNLYLSMDMATESEVADIEGSTATGAPL